MRRWFNALRENAALRRRIAELEAQHFVIMDNVISAADRVGMCRSMSVDAGIAHGMLCRLAEQHGTGFPRRPAHVEARERVKAQLSRIADDEPDIAAKRAIRFAINRLG